MYSVPGSSLSGRVVVAGYCAGAVARGPVLIPITGMAGGDLMGFDAMQLAVRDQRPDTVDAPEARSCPRARLLLELKKLAARTQLTYCVRNTRGAVYRPEKLSLFYSFVYQRGNFKKEKSKILF